MNMPQSSLTNLAYSSTLYFPPTNEEMMTVTVGVKCQFRLSRPVILNMAIQEGLEVGCLIGVLMNVESPLYVFLFCT